MKTQPVVLATYNGVDGACAAAMALQVYPEAQIRVTSAGRIDQTLDLLAQDNKSYKEVHVLGVGAYCEWDSLVKAAAALKQKGTRLVWHCGRGYLDDRRGMFDEICQTKFETAGSNTAAVCRSLGIDASRPNPSRLLEIAKRDPGLHETKAASSLEIAFWCDLIDASISHYFKFQDDQRYPQTIQRLAKGIIEKEDEQLVRTFKLLGWKYLIQGKSPIILKLKRQIKLVAEIDEPVIITGETGTGKEHVAHLIHEASSRADQPFVPINCAMFAGNTTLANSTLFGHVRGAFTDAVKDRKGVFVQAQGGILYLDELCHLPLEIQAKLLRVVEDGKIVPEGADNSLPVNVRLVVASNRDLPSLIRQGRFLPDLYHRLATLRINVPSLRERPEDIDAIVERTLADLTDQGIVSGIKKKDWTLLKEYSWPGNVRQLIKLVRRAAYMNMPLSEALDEERRLGSLTPESQDGGGSNCPIWPNSREEVILIQRVDEIYARRAFELHHGNHTATRKALGIGHHYTLNNLLNPESCQKTTSKVNNLTASTRKK